MGERLKPRDPKTTNVEKKKAEIENASEYIDSKYLIKELGKIEAEKVEDAWWELEGKTDTQNLGC